MAEADEEGGGPYSTVWLVREHWPDVDAEFALNEGGWIMKGDDGHVRYVSISTADKSSIPLTVRCNLPLPAKRCVGRLAAPLILETRSERAQPSCFGLLER